MNRKWLLIVGVIVFVALGCKFSGSATTGASGNEAAQSGPSPTATKSEIPATEPTPQPTVKEDPPDALIKSVYKDHQADLAGNAKLRIVNYKNRAQLDRYFEKKLADLIWNDMKTHQNEIGVIDFDIFSNSQDPELKNLSIGAAEVTGDTASVKVTFSNYGTKETLTYVLAKKDGKWKIRDIKYPDGYTLVKYFETAPKE